MPQKKLSKSIKLKEVSPFNVLEKKSSKHIIQLSKSSLAFLQAMQKLLSKTQPNKIRRMIKQIKNLNNSFKQYFLQNRIANIHYEDLVKFQQMYHQTLQDVTKKQTLHTLQQIRYGFNDLKRRMQQFQVTDLMTQMKYCSSVIARQVDKLNKLDQQYQGAYLIRNPHPITRHIQLNERENGYYEYLNKNQIQKAAIIEQAELKFKTVLSQKCY